MGVQARICDDELVTTISGDCKVTTVMITIVDVSLDAVFREGYYLPTHGTRESFHLSFVCAFFVSDVRSDSVFCDVFSWDDKIFVPA